MVDSSTFRSGSRDLGPALIYGTGRDAIERMAVALARPTVVPFGWVHCAPDADGLGREVRRILDDASSGAVEFLRDPSELDRPEHRVRRLSQFFLDEPRTLSFEVRLVAYLGLPPPVQRVLARVLSPEGRSVLVVTGLNANSPTATRAAFARPEMLETLRREGTTLVVAYRGTPEDRFKRAFPRIFRIDRPSAGTWTDATVVAEEGEHPTCADPPATPLRRWIEFLERPADRSSARRRT